MTGKIVDNNEKENIKERKGEGKNEMYERKRGERRKSDKRRRRKLR